MANRDWPAKKRHIKWENDEKGSNLALEFDGLTVIRHAAATQCSVDVRWNGNPPTE